MHIHARIAAVRKNRYVILPVDFEEAWKVRCLFLFGAHHRRLYKSLTRLFFSSLQQTVKRADDTLEFCTSLLLTGNVILLIDLFTVRQVIGSFSFAAVVSRHTTSPPLSKSELTSIPQFFSCICILLDNISIFLFNSPPWREVW